MGIPTHQPIATITLSSNASSVTFSGITQQYRDLILRSTWGGTSNGYVRIHPNGSTSDFSIVLVQSGVSTSPQSVIDTVSYAGNIRSDNIAAVSVVNIMDYAQTDKHKIWTGRGQEVAANDIFFAVRWGNNSPITSLVISPLSGSFLAGTIISLYGVSA